MTTLEHDVVFLLDVDNTLLDNDAVKVDMAAQLRALLGDELAEQFWDEYEEVRRLTSVVDLPLTFERFAPYVNDEAKMAVVRAIIMDYAFATRVFPETMATLAHLRTLGTPVIVSDGDTTYQPHKVERSGLAEAVEWQVIIYVHKEDHLDEILARWPARYYVMVDDKARILAATKRRMPDRVVTVHLLQGHYAQATTQFAPPPDIVLANIGDLRKLTAADFEPHLKR
jgi:FMN phosphatase YigB (HAD superfamily)